MHFPLFRVLAWLAGLICISRIISIMWAWSPTHSWILRPFGIRRRIRSTITRESGEVRSWGSWLRSTMYMRRFKGLQGFNCCLFFHFDFHFRVCLWFFLCWMHSSMSLSFLSHGQGFFLNFQVLFHQRKYIFDFYWFVSAGHSQWLARNLQSIHLDCPGYFLVVVTLNVETIPLFHH